MKKLAYILSDNKINGLRPYVELINDIELYDQRKPLLIVGMANAKKFAGDKFSILNRQISEKVFWTFKRTERRQDFENDLILFYNNIFNNIINNINYYYINLIKINFNKIKKLYNILFTSDHNNKKYFFIKNDMLFFLLEENKVIGISFRLLKYCKISKKKVYLKIKNIPNSVIGFENSEGLSDFKEDVRGNEYIMPYIMSLIDAK